MARLRGAITAVAIAAFIVAAPAYAGTLVLHPSGFGEMSYSAWKAGEGLNDSQGSKEQALYFQKNTATATNAAGVAVFKGVEGLPTSDLGELSFYWRTDGYCGAGAPRFNVRIETALGMRQTVFVGCQGMAPSTGGSNENGVFEKRTFVGTLPPGTIVSLALVFDEGNDLPTSRCDGVSALVSGAKCVYLDNIRAANHTWTSASDNGNGEDVIQSSTPLAVLLWEPIDLALG
jgi:hypothetical protein